MLPHPTDLNGNRGQHWLTLYLLCSRLRSRHCFHKIISSHKPSRMQSHVVFPSQMEKSAKQKNEGSCPRPENKGLEKLGWELRFQGQSQTQSQDSGQGPLSGSPARPQTHTEPCKISLVLKVFTESSEPPVWPLWLTDTVTHC